MMNDDINNNVFFLKMKWKMCGNERQHQDLLYLFYEKDKSVVTNGNTAEKYIFCEIEEKLENPYSTRKSGRYLFIV